MKELKKLFLSYYQNLGISSSISFQEKTEIIGKDLQEEGNTLFNFLYKGKNCKIILEGKGDKVNALIEVLRVTFNYTDSQTIKDKNDYIIKTLLGVCQNPDLNEKYNIKYNSCVVLAVKSKGSSEEIASFLPIYTPCLTAVINQDLCAIIKPSDLDKEDYLSLTRFAKVLRCAIEEEIGFSVSIGIGSPCDLFIDIYSSYLQAVKALEYGEGANRGVYSYLEILPQKMIASLTNKDKQYFLKPFYSLLKNKELTASAKEFLNCDLNINKASEKLYIHRNTLIYRLNKIEKLVGLDLRNFNDAVTFRLVCLLNDVKEI